MPMRLSMASSSKRIRVDLLNRAAICVAAAAAAPSLRPAASLAPFQRSFSRLASPIDGTITRTRDSCGHRRRSRSRSRARSFSPLLSFSSMTGANNTNQTIPTTTTTTQSEQIESQSKESSQQRLFRKVLIANRGEISIRVAKTCRRLGIPTVAVYASNDAGSKHIAEADEAVCLGIGGTAAAYTDLPSLLDAIRSTGADAVHPGYGFLSENADFADAVQELGVAWLGPPAQAIVDMGCKLRSKDIAREAGVAIIPGCDDGALESVEEALELMNRNNNTNNNTSNNGLEYPVLLKAAAGGGGKGMRICRNDKELIEGYPLAQSEGLKFFADGRLLLEQYLEGPHHIEFQVVCSKRPPIENTNMNTKTNTEHDGDGDGGGGGAPIVDVAIFAERECSVQRRNQKVVEESPSCLLTEATRREMMEQTALLCQKVGYEGAGTVEWLVVGADPTKTSSSSSQKFYFLEMNTRLQVEHPITEAVSHNVDLVEAMLEVGSGNGLPKDWYNTATIVETTGDNEGTMLVMPWKGHSIEGRIYAEDPLRGYLPSTGPLVPYKEPLQALAFGDGSKIHGNDKDSSSSSYLRLDSGVVEGHVVTPFYDPMLSKIISYAPTREEAIQVLSDGLDSYVIEGVQHNAKLVQAVLRHPSFRSGKTPTSFLEEEIPDFREYRYEYEYDGDDSNDIGGASASTATANTNTNANENGSTSLLSASEEEELAVAVAMISRSREALLGLPPVAGGAGGEDSRMVVIRLGGLFGNTDAFSVTTIVDENDESKAHVHRMGAVQHGEETHHRVIDLGKVALDLEHYLARVTLDGMERTLQVRNEPQSGELKVQMHGAEYAGCLVQSPREYELSKHMLPPVIEDTSNVVMSPMPGTLIGFSKGTSPGDFVVEGQELCIVEAMKMQNIVRAPREGIVSKLCVEEGAALVTDQVILEFEDTDGDEEKEASVA